MAEWTQCCRNWTGRSPSRGLAPHVEPGLTSLLLRGPATQAALLQVCPCPGGLWTRPGQTWPAGNGRTGTEDKALRPQLAEPLSSPREVTESTKQPHEIGAVAGHFTDEAAEAGGGKLTRLGSWDVDTGHPVLPCCLPSAWMHEPAHEPGMSTLP